MRNKRRNSTVADAGHGDSGLGPAVADARHDILTAMFRLAPLLIAATLTAPACAADRPAPAPMRNEIVTLSPPTAPVPLPIVVPPPVLPVVIAPTFRDPRTGRCRAGFVLNVAGACVRPDDPRIVCGAPPDLVGPDICAVAPPDPAPYGIGASLRLNY